MLQSKSQCSLYHTKTEILLGRKTIVFPLRYWDILTHYYSILSLTFPYMYLHISTQIRRFFVFFCLAQRSNQHHQTQHKAGKFLQMIKTVIIRLSLFVSIFIVCGAPSEYTIEVNRTLLHHCSISFSISWCNSSVV